MKVAVVIPAFNEESSIGSTVRAAKSFCDVIVVNDCSSDRTSENARQAGALVVDLLENSGYDGAIEAGFSGCRGFGFQSRHYF